MKKKVSFTVQCSDENAVIKNQNGKVWTLQGMYTLQEALAVLVSSTISNEVLKACNFYSSFTLTTTLEIND